MPTDLDTVATARKSGRNGGEVRRGVI